MHTTEPKIGFCNTNIAIYPNPFNSSVTIKYFINDDSKVQLITYDVLGKKFKTLSNKFENTRLLSMIWDSKDQREERVASGIYFVSLVVQNQKQFKNYY